MWRQCQAWVDSFTGEGEGGTKSLEIKKVGRKGENGSLEEKKEEEKWVFFFKSV